jgi:hypothetical protein
MSDYPKEALRISGILYLLKRETGVDVVQQEEFIINAQDLLNLVKNKKIPDALLSRFQYYSEKNKQENSRYHEGIFYELYLNLLNEDISDDTFLRELRELLFKEEQYIRAVDYSMTNSQFKFPINSQKAEKMLSEPNNNLNEIDFKKHKFHEGAFITGIPGIGKSYLAFSLFEKNIIEGGGGMCFSLELADINRVYSLMKNLNREDDLMIFSSQDYKDLLKKDLSSLVNNNKVVLFYLAESFSFLNEDKWLSLVENLIQFFYIKSQSIQSESGCFMVVFDELFRHMIKHKEMLEIIVKILQERKIMTVFVEQHYHNLLMKDFSVKNLLFMKQSPELFGLVDSHKEKISGLKFGEVCFIRREDDAKKMVTSFCLESGEPSRFPDECIYFGMW